ncbi:MAG: FtsX-like permease family protein [Bacteroidota bacterium]
MKYDKAKSIGIIIGIIISIFLIGQQLGILGFLTGLMGGLVENSRYEMAQIWVVDVTTENANSLPQINESLVREIKSINGVAETYPMVIASASIKFKDGNTASLLLVGSEAPHFVAGPRSEKIAEGDINALLNPGAISADIFDENTLGNNLDIGTRLEINGKEAFIRMKTNNARGFSGSFGYTTLTQARYYANLPNNKVNAIAVKVKPGYAMNNVIKAINNSIYGVRAWDVMNLKNTTVKRITVSSNIGTSVGSLVIFAIISGFFIIGLTLYSSVLDRLKDYGTLKAIGATNGYVRKLILVQAFLFAVIGFSLAYFLLQGFKNAVANVGLVFEYSTGQLVSLFVITLFISIGGSLFAIKRVNAVDPAFVFKG